MSRNNRSINNLDLCGSPPSNPAQIRQNPAGEVTPMKASAFSYARATSVVNALQLLTAHGDGAKLLSGGQSLMPAMNLRLISPELIVVIGSLAEWRAIILSGEFAAVRVRTGPVSPARAQEIVILAPPVPVDGVD